MASRLTASLASERRQRRQLSRDAVDVGRGRHHGDARRQVGEAGDRRERGAHRLVLGHRHALAREEGEQVRKPDRPLRAADGLGGQHAHALGLVVEGDREQRQHLLGRERAEDLDHDRPGRVRRLDVRRDAAQDARGDLLQLAREATVVDRDQGVLAPRRIGILDDAEEVVPGESTGLGPGARDRRTLLEHVDVGDRPASGLLVEVGQHALERRAHAGPVLPEDVRALEPRQGLEVAGLLAHDRLEQREPGLDLSEFELDHGEHVAVGGAGRVGGPQERDLALRRGPVLALQVDEREVLPREHVGRIGREALVEPAERRVPVLALDRDAGQELERLRLTRAWRRAPACSCASASA